ncbi:Hypothetical protein, putative [Bodo saltans]|uniref:Uncharacterized protein n=1 Tax=Bodo saltans TaxID=75058 RepID=A0A0S4J9E2_BODSA|nr:Hypothetical protein, putative [Bodo saltans]|eukprot:CUG87875.1 Hypothetical protein, putative [Bodo saltans]
MTTDSSGHAHPPAEPLQTDSSPVSRVRQRRYLEESTSMDSGVLSPTVPNTKSTPRRSRDESTTTRSRSTSISQNPDRTRSTERVRSGSRRQGAGIVRELFRIQTQLSNIGVDEQIGREDVASQEAISFARIFSFSLLTRTISSETQRRMMLTREEDAAWQLTKKLVTSAIKSMHIDQLREKESVAVTEVMTGDNRLYDRMLRKRQQMGLQTDVAKTIEAESQKLQKAALLGKQASEQDVQNMRTEVELLKEELTALHYESDSSPTRGKGRKTKELDRKRKQERLEKLLEMIEAHEQREEVERKRVERTANLKGVDKDVLSGKKTVVASKMEKELERQRREHEDEIEIALRRALQNEKKEPSGAKTARNLNSTVTKLPSISKSEPPSVAEKPIRTRARAGSSVSASP